jgi:hypothetical protein
VRLPCKNSNIASPRPVGKKMKWRAPGTLTTRAWATFSRKVAAESGENITDREIHFLSPVAGARIEGLPSRPSSVSIARPGSSTQTGAPAMSLLQERRRSIGSGWREEPSL